MTRIFSRFLNSPAALVGLVLCWAALGAVWYVKSLAPTPPIFSGWNWREHPNTLLISFHAECGCGTGLSEMVAQGRQHKRDVLVVTDLRNREADALAKRLSPAAAHLVSGLDAPTFGHLSPAGRTTAYDVQNGRMAGPGMGVVSDASFRK